MPHFFVFLLASCAYAFVRGGPPERACAALMMVGAALTLLIMPDVGTRYGHFETGVFAVDFALLVAFVGLALCCERYWPMWISSMQLVTVVSHIVGVIVATSTAWAYAMAVSLWSYPMILLMVIGTVRHQQRIKQHKVDTDWIVGL